MTRIFATQALPHQNRPKFNCLMQTATLIPPKAGNQQLWNQISDHLDSEFHRTWQNDNSFEAEPC
jgi:hypothetical protein